MRIRGIITGLSGLYVIVLIHGSAAGAYRLEDSPSSEVASRTDAGQATSLDRLNSLLRCSEPVDRAERIDRWRKIHNLAKTHAGVARLLREMAGKSDLEVGRYPRFIAAANVAGFGMPTRIGPNNLGYGIKLGIYISVQKSISMPVGEARSLRLDPKLQQLEVVVSSNEDDSLYFQEILWRILEKYDLDFRSEPDGAFLIVPANPEVSRQRAKRRAGRDIDEILAEQRRDEGGDSPMDRLNSLLQDIKSIDRIERIYRWMEIRELAETQGSGIAFHLRKMADKTDREVGRYQRYIAAANVAGFGNPTRFGPNSINIATPLEAYVNIQRSMVTKSHPKPDIQIHPDLQRLEVTIPPNKGDGLYFHEILWRILEKYDLDFRTKPSGVFLIVPRDHQGEK